MRGGARAAPRHPVLHQGPHVHARGAHDGRLAHLRRPGARRGRRLRPRLAAAGGIFLGKTTTPEFGWKGLGDSPVTGITRNPWNPAMTTGGSSAGAGAAAAAGLGPLHQGSDGAGSIRIPSAFCGVFGLKPSYGRVPQWPVSNNDQTTHNGPMTRTVADAALMLSVMAGPDERDRTSLEGAPEDYVGRLRTSLRACAWLEPRHGRPARRSRGGGDRGAGRARLRRPRRVGGGGEARLRRHARDDPLPLVRARGRQLRPVPRAVARPHGPGARGLHRGRLSRYARGLHPDEGQEDRAVGHRAPALRDATRCCSRRRSPWPRSPSAA